MNIYPDVLSINGKKAENKSEWKKRRQEILDLLSNEEYGFMPKKPERVWGNITDIQTKCAAGHGAVEFIDIHFDTPKGEFSFPIRYIYPTEKESSPTFVLLNFRPDLYDMYYPLEEIIDRGFAIACVNYQDVVSDNSDFTTGLASMYPISNPQTAWGKIGMWAFAASRIADYLEIRKETDIKNLAVIGHSRLGKTALWCGANDERFRFVISNGSGCCGAAYEREKIPEGETIAQITERFPFWFCKNFLKYSKNPEEREFEQHFLLALTAPRFVLIGSANRDLWADPYGEQLSCIGASPVWALYNKDGFIGPTEPAKVNESFDEGSIHYHLRDGIHFLSRRDWNFYMDFIDKKL